METFGSLIGTVVGLTAVVFLLVLVFLGITLPIWVYAAQKWAHNCFKELQHLNRRMDDLAMKSQDFST